MKTLRTLGLLCIATLLSAASWAATVDVAGVKLEDSIDLQGSKLQLNGAGVRTKVIFKVYVAGLYLNKKAATPAEVLAATGPKRMSLTMLRDIDAGELGKLFTQGVEDNTAKSEMSKLIPGLIRMGQLFADQKKLKSGDNVLIDWVPGTGTTLTINGKLQPDPFKEPEFFTALMRIWFGDKPADAGLKEALLGKGA
ncbi:MAG: chalcone isomerase family protein [Pseudomonadota bacterium]